MNVVPMISETLPSQGSTLEQLPLSVTVRVVEDLEAWTALRQQWNDLNENSVYPNVFSTWEWLTEWWKAFGGSARLRILVVDYEGQLIGLLPLYSKRSGRFKSASLRLIGQGAAVVPDYLGLVAKEPYLDLVCESLAEYLAEPTSTWSSLHLHEYAADDPGTARLVDVVSHQFSRLQTTGEPRLLINLPNTYDALLATLSGHNRQRKRARLRQARDRFGAQFREIPPEQLDNWFPVLEELTHKARQRTGAKSAYELAAYASFQRGVLKLMLPMGLAKLFVLLLNDLPASYWYVFCYSGKMYAYQTATDAELPGSPGDVALQMVLQEAISKQLVEFDFLCGNHDYERGYTSTARETMTVHFYRAYGFKYLMRLSADKVARPTKRWAQRLLRAIKV